VNAHGFNAVSLLSRKGSSDAANRPSARQSAPSVEPTDAYPVQALKQALPKKIENWSLTSLQQRLVKTGGRLVKHARYYWLMLTESHLTRRLFGSMVRRIDALAVATG
jgi:hypothetical protein